MSFADFTGKPVYFFLKCSSCFAFIHFNPYSALEVMCSNFLKAALIILTLLFQYRCEGISSKILCCLVTLPSLSYEVLLKRTVVYHVYTIYRDMVLNSCSIVARCSDQSRRWNGLACGLCYCCVCYTPLNIELIFTHS